LYRNIKDDYKYLKNEMEEIKKQITKPDFVADILPPKIDEIAITPEPITEVEVSPSIIPDPVNSFEEFLQNEDVINEETVEKPVLSFDSQVIPVYDSNNIAEEKETPKTVEIPDTEPVYQFEEQTEPQHQEDEIYVESAF